MQINTLNFNNINKYNFQTSKIKYNANYTTQIYALKNQSFLRFGEKQKINSVIRGLIRKFVKQDIQEAPYTKVIDVPDADYPDCIIKKYFDKNNCLRKKEFIPSSQIPEYVCVYDENGKIIYKLRAQYLLGKCGYLLTGIKNGIQFKKILSLINHQLSEC